MINKVTTLYPTPGSSLTEAQIQEHLDANNADGWELVTIIDLVGWYRFFWAK